MHWTSYQPLYNMRSAQVTILVAAIGHIMWNRDATKKYNHQAIRAILEKYIVIKFSVEADLCRLDVNDRAFSVDTCYYVVL